MIRERFKIERYLVTEARPSQIDPEVIRVHTIGIICPSCKTMIEFSDENMQRTCQCGAQVSWNGDYLYCTVNAPKVKTLSWWDKLLFWLNHGIKL